MIARRNHAAAFRLRLSPRYAQSLHRSYQGELDFNTAWKSASDAEKSLSRGAGPSRGLAEVERVLSKLIHAQLCASG